MGLLRNTFEFDFSKDDNPSVSKIEREIELKKEKQHAYFSSASDAVQGHL